MDGKVLRKRFRGKFYLGSIQFNRDDYISGNGPYFFNVKYEDGDMESMTYAEVVRYISELL